MKTLAKLFVPLTLFLLFTTSPILATPAFTDFAAVDAYIENYMQEHRISGLALAVVKDDQIIYARGYGIADSSGRPVTAQTPFIIGSTSKSLTALAVMQLVDAGKVDLDAPVQTYLPWFTVGDGAITVRQILNHTSGISKDAGQDALVSNDSGDNALEQQVRKINEIQLAHAPGSTYEYANANYETAGLVIQDVSGQSFEDYLQKFVFDPLEMKCSYTSKVEAERHELAKGFHYWFGFPLPAGNTPYPRQKIPSGYQILCVEDMAHTLIAHLNDGKYKNIQIVSAKGMAELHRPALENYAMGWIRNDLGVLEHGGSVPDYGSEIILDPQHDLGIAVFYNINNVIGAQPVRILPWNVLNLLTNSIVTDTPSNQPYLYFLAGIIGLLLMAVAWLLVSRAWLNQWKNQPAKRPRGLGALTRLGIPVIIEWGILAVVFQAVASVAYGFQNLLLHQPDLTILLLIWIGLVILNSCIRTIAGIRLIAQK